MSEPRVVRDAFTKYTGKPVLTYGEPLVVCTHVGVDGLEMSRDFRVDGAGAELNTAVGLARLRTSAAYAAVLAEDPFGEFLLRELRAEGVDASRVEQVPNGSTGVLFKMRDALGLDPQVFYYRSQSPMALGEWKADRVLRDVKAGAFAWVHTTGIGWMVSQATRERSLDLLQAAFESGTPTSFDVNIRLKMAGIKTWLNMLEEILPYVSWVFIGDTEAEILFGTVDTEEISTAVKQLGFHGDGFVVKRGSNGASASVNGVTTDVSAYPVSRVVDTVGAGDGFNAGFIAAKLRRFEVVRCLELGSYIGACAVTSTGDYAGYPTWRKIITYFSGEREVTR